MSIRLAILYTELSGYEIDALHCTNHSAVNSAFADWMRRVAKHNGGTLPHSVASIQTICEQIRLYILRSGVSRTIDYINDGNRHEIVDLDADDYYSYNPNFRYLQRTSRTDRSQVTVNRPRTQLKSTQAKIREELNKIFPFPL